MKTDDRFGNTISYYYEAGLLTKIAYSNGSYVSLDRIISQAKSGIDVNIIYNDGAASTSLAVLRLNNIVNPGSKRVTLLSAIQPVGKADTSFSYSIAASGVSVLYNINAEVAVTDYHSYYGLSQNGFNCYTFAIGKDTEIRNPGYYSSNTLPLTSATGIRSNVHADQVSLSRTSSNSTLAATIPNSHSWKIVQKIRIGSDYHFMKMSYGTSKPWQFKAGKPGPVMQLRDTYTPSSASWDLYSISLLNGKYFVDTEDFYNDSNIFYMIIND